MTVVAIYADGNVANFQDAKLSWGSEKMFTVEQANRITYIPTYNLKQISEEK